MCDAVHPDLGVKCWAPAPAHPKHYSRHQATQVFWDNPEGKVVPLPDPKAPTKAAAEKDKARAVQKAIKVERERLGAIEKARPPDRVYLGPGEGGRRNVGVQSSVQPDDPAARMDGSEQAYQAVEEEFRVAAMEGGVALSRIQERWTADDFWDWLDGHGHHTKHPKAMAGLLRSLIREKVIEPVPDEDPDSHRPPARSNQSRLLRVYRSLIFDSSPPVLRHFEPEVG